MSEGTASEQAALAQAVSSITVPPPGPGEFSKVKDAVKPVAAPRLPAPWKGMRPPKENREYPSCEAASLKCLMRGSLTIKGRRVDTLFHSLRLIDTVYMKDQALKGIFVRGKVNAMYHVGGCVGFSRPFGWRTMDYDRFRYYCALAENVPAEEEDKSEEEETDKYVSPFIDPAFNIEIECLRAINSELRFGERTKLDVMSHHCNAKYYPVYACIFSGTLIMTLTC